MSWLLRLIKSISFRNRKEENTTKERKKKTATTISNSINDDMSANFCAVPVRSTNDN